MDDDMHLAIQAFTVVKTQVLCGVVDQAGYLSAFDRRLNTRMSYRLVSRIKQNYSSMALASASSYLPRNLRKTDAATCHLTGISSD